MSDLLTEIAEYLDNISEDGARPLARQLYERLAATPPQPSAGLRAALERLVRAHRGYRLGEVTLDANVVDDLIQEYALLLAAKPDAGEGLDVERLARAMHKVKQHRSFIEDCWHCNGNASDFAAAYLRATTDETGGGE